MWVVCWQTVSDAVFWVSTSDWVVLVFRSGVSIVNAAEAWRLKAICVVVIGFVELLRLGGLLLCFRKSEGRLIFASGIYVSCCSVAISIVIVFGWNSFNDDGAEPRGDLGSEVFCSLK